MKNKSTIPSLRYSSEIQNTYNKIATLLHHFLPHFQTAPQPTPVPEQKVPGPHPAIIEDSVDN